MPALDPRLTPARPDLAAAHLKGQVEAARFVEPVDYQAIAASVPIRRTPEADGAVDDQLLAGDIFALLEEKDGWGWGFSRADGFVGWVDLLALSTEVEAVDHRVTALRTYAFSRPDLKSEPNLLLSLNCSFRAGRRESRYVEAIGLGWVFVPHCATLDEQAGDFVAVAESFLGAPYLWGGKESLGLDCSGLVQMALLAAGTALPRDSDQQEAHLAAHWRDVTGRPERQRGDIVFWPGHVGIMTDSEHLLHANGHWMDVTLEEFAAAERRIREAHAPVRAIYRQA
ncbi:C40 family peptidase [Maricaulis salignorans]|uniref:NlpC/P60 family protein n=1 Tax=Maricaulis salignorans TaxID=144026 RepID=A0A1G9NE10_9PROT|nr:NlpC/P60 family protein [Maricaulis salignorans]SDL84357.1 NlpC/P60 family protein [Maricaulis salignorans]